MMRYLWLVPVLAVAGCNHEIYVRDGVTDGDTFYVAPIAFIDSDPALQSWVAYSLARSVCQLEQSAENPARATSFSCELQARKILADSWEDRRAGNASIGDGYLDELLIIRDAGFLREYTAKYFRRSGWHIPNDVDVEAFETWRRQNLGRHKPQTRIVGYWANSDRVSGQSPR